VMVIITIFDIAVKRFSSPGLERYKNTLTGRGCITL